MSNPGNPKGPLMPTPDIDIGELRKLEAAATPGEWLWQDVAGAGLQIYAPVHLVPSLKMPDGMPREPIFIYSLRGMSGYMGIGDERWVQFEPEGWNAMQTANAAFITALRNAAPALLAAAEEGERLRAENESLRDQIVHIGKRCVDVKSRLTLAVSAIRESLHETEMMNAWTARQILTHALSYEGKSE